MRINTTNIRAPNPSSYINSNGHILEHDPAAVNLYFIEEARRQHIKIDIGQRAYEKNRRMQRMVWKFHHTRKENSND